MSTICNPILKGFNPDPCITCKGDDFYIATSTFEWFPGIALYHSRDLANWRLVGHALTRPSQLDLRGVQSSEGIWAPDLAYSNDEDLFYITYTEMRNWAYEGPRDMHNCLVTSKSIEGPWSDPVLLDSGGIDPSLFFHPDGRVFYLRNLWDYRAGTVHFAGIIMQQYDRKQKKLVGESRTIFKGTGLGLVEGPHLYYHNGYYYLMTAEGGTFFNHVVTLARSKELWGPYEAQPSGPVLTSKLNPNNPLQKAGHGSLVQDKRGNWYLSHLCGRPLPSRGRCILGREASIQRVVWKEDGWLYLAHGGVEPALIVKAEGLEEHPWQRESSCDDFDSAQLRPCYQTLRCRLEEHFCNTIERPGYLRLRGRQSMTSRFEQTLIARRQRAFCYTATTALECEPVDHNQLAGLIAFYDHQHFYYLAVTRLDGKRVMNIYYCNRGAWNEPVKPVSVNDAKRIYLKMEMRYDQLFCSYSLDETSWRLLGPSFDSSILSDDYLQPVHFTGAFIGLCAQDLQGQGFVADFDYFTYEE